MSGRRHRSNCELVAQGVANIAATIFGGMSVTGTIARTATNVRSGAKGPISGMLHAVYILLFMLLATPLASYIPLASLGAVLTMVAWNMTEQEAFVALVKSSKGDALVLLATFLLTVFEDLALGIAVGVTLGVFLFMHRMAEAIEVQNGVALFGEDQADNRGDKPVADEAGAAPNGNFMIYKISGAFFFGATSAVSAVLDRIGRYPRTFVFNFEEVPLIDSTPAKTIEAFIHKLRRSNTQVCIAGARPSVRRVLLAAGFHEPDVIYTGTVQEARERSRHAAAESSHLT